MTIAKADDDQFPPLAHYNSLSDSEQTAQINFVMSKFREARDKIKAHTGKDDLRFSVVGYYKYSDEIVVDFVDDDSKANIHIPFDFNHSYAADLCVEIVGGYIGPTDGDPPALGLDLSDI